MLLRIALITAFYFGLLLDMHFANGGWKQTLDVGNLSIMVFSWIFLLFLFFAVEASFKQKYARWINAGLAFVYTILNYYQRNTGQSLDFSIVANNWHATTHPDSFRQTLGLVYNTFIAANVFWSVVIASLIFWSYRWSPRPELSRPRRHGFQLAFLVCGILLTTKFGYSHDQYSRLGRSVILHYFPLKTHLDEVADRLALLPEVTVESKFKIKEKPNVIFVLVEALNARFINQKHTDGREYTPNLNKLVHEATYYASNYYSNSVQTGKGHFAAFCGQVSSTNSIEFRSATEAKLECMPAVMKSLGYHNVFMKAHSDANFDNEQVFLLAHDVHEADAIAKTCSEEKDPCFGWGIRDDYFYRRAFARLAERADKQPIFTMLATITTHQPFMGVPPEQRAFFPEQKTRREGYLNALKVADDAIPVLMDEFRKSPLAKNSILIITGDHGFPLGEHGNSHNENYAFNENFKVPLLIFDYRAGVAVQAKQQVWNEPLSHLNLPATMLDMIGYSGPTPFVGQSLFSGHTVDVPVYLVQPYSGGFLGVVLGKYKYIFDSSRGGEQVYDLQVDPEERENILPRVNPEILASLQRAAAQIKRQQEIFRRR